MTTVVLAPPASTLATTEQRIVVRSVSWDSYITISNSLDNQPGLRLTYDRGSLEFMTHSAAHEIAKRWLMRLIETMAEESQRVIVPGGNMTFRREDIERGLEPDDCLWIENAPAMLGQRTWDPTQHPVPDLALEIEITRSALDRMSIYAALGVSEVWRYNGTVLVIEVLQSDQTYQTVPASPTFPTVSASEIVKFIEPFTTFDYLSAVRAFRDWFRQNAQP